MLKNGDLKIYDGIREYCGKYNIPIDNLLEILEDQKVLPMIRGKATEYIATVIISQTLPPRIWQVQKLNLNAQANQYDEDISITHSKTGYRLKVEAKNAVRGSFKVGNKRTLIKEPHYRVKCHKSRSHLSRASTTNDRYMLGDFDVIVCNVSNALFQGGTISDQLELLHDRDAVTTLKSHYEVNTDQEVIRSAYDDWRFCFPNDIALEDGSIPRTPSVKLTDDENWFGCDELESRLLPELERIRRI